MKDNIIKENLSGKPDLVLKNGFIVDVFNQDIYKGDVAIKGNKIIGTGSYDADLEIDCSELYIVPGFIDAHVHIESSKVIPQVFSRELIKKGVLACIADPHEIANVHGINGIDYIIDDARKSIIDIYFMIPSCVPAVEFEDNGANLNAYDIEKFKRYPDVLGLGEVMDVNAVITKDKNMGKKLEVFKDMVIDGHCPIIENKSLDEYIVSGIKTDHECASPSEALEKVKKGMYVMLREGSAAKNIEQLLPAVNEKNFHRFLFCTDDRSIKDIHYEGSIDNNVRKSIKLGLDPIKAITIATINAAECYGLKDKGAVAPGYKADLLLLSDLNKVIINNIIKNGKVYNENNNVNSIEFANSINMDHISEDMIKIPYKPSKVNVIKINKDTIITEKIKRTPVCKDGLLAPGDMQGILKVAVFERHKKTGKFGIGLIEGLGISGCSVAQSIAHDSHNIITAGDNDIDMVNAVNRVIDIGGGIVLASGGNIIEEISLPCAGLMTAAKSDEVIKRLDKLYGEMDKFKTISNTDIFLTLSFMALPVIPELKITSRGLYDYKEGKFIDLYEDYL